jgi:hypothetical protein
MAKKNPDTRRRYTASKDGIKRCNVTIRIRLTREAVEALERHIAEEKPFLDSLEDLCEAEASLALEQVLADCDFYEQPQQ